MLLTFYILLYYFIGNITRAGRKIASGPNVATPELPFHFGKLHKHFSRRLTFHTLYHFAYTKFRRIRHEQMYMILRYMSFYNFNFFLVTYFSKQFTYPLRYLSTKNMLSIFCDPYKMHLQVITSMTTGSVIFHETNLLKSSPEGEGFIPRKRH